MSGGRIESSGETLVNERARTIVVDIDSVDQDLIFEGLSGDIPRIVRATIDGETTTLPDIQAGSQTTVPYRPKRRNRVRRGAGRVKDGIANRARPVTDSRPAQFVVDHKFAVSLAALGVMVVGVLASFTRVGRRRNRWNGW